MSFPRYQWLWNVVSFLVAHLYLTPAVIITIFVLTFRYGGTAGVTVLLGVCILYSLTYFDGSQYSGAYARVGHVTVDVSIVQANAPGRHLFDRFATAIRIFRLKL
jgi:ABC-type phosphate transport system permease subunit